MHARILLFLFCGYFLPICHAIPSNELLEEVTGCKMILQHPDFSKLFSFKQGENTPFLTPGTNTPLRVTYTTLFSPYAAASCALAKIRLESNSAFYGSQHGPGYECVYDAPYGGTRKIVLILSGVLSPESLERINRPQIVDTKLDKSKGEAMPRMGHMDASTLAKQTAHLLISEIVHGKKSVAALKPLLGTATIQLFLKDRAFLSWSALMQKESKTGPFPSLPKETLEDFATNAVITGDIPLSKLLAYNAIQQIKDIMDRPAFVTWAERMMALSKN